MEVWNVFNILTGKSTGITPLGMPRLKLGNAKKIGS